MYGRNSAGPDAAVTEVEARRFGSSGEPRTSSPHIIQTQPLRAVLVGDDTCVMAGFAARGPAPILKQCRILTDAGRSDRPLEARRGDTLCVTVNSDCRNTASN